ncbi:MAG: HAMP domain-containing sensor histidine kinase, partial [Thermodesulfovibrionales bacterium]
KDRGKLHLPDVPWIEVSVADTGPGIPHDIVDKIFDPFFTTKPVGEGTGLGLSICHRIVEEHNGSIDVESEIGVGTTIIIRFPAKAQDDKSSCS